MSRSPIINEKVFDIPGVQYFFSVDVDEATWQYKIYTYHWLSINSIDEQCVYGIGRYLYFEDNILTAIQD